jgi:hypothetical protein
VGIKDVPKPSILSEETHRIFVARKQQVKSSRTIRSEYEPDFLAFHPLSRNCYIVEVKDGDQFDTKKAAGERQMLENFRTDISRSVPYITHYPSPTKTGSRNVLDLGFASG